MSDNCHQMAWTKLLFLLLTLAKVSGDKVQVLRVPEKTTWAWSATGSKIEWYAQTIPDPNQQVRYYAACPSLPNHQSNSWLRSDPVSVNNTRRIDVTVEYSVVNCSAPNRSPDYCKTTFDIYAHLAREMYTPDKIPDPYTNPNVYDKISAVDPKVLAYPKIQKMQNVETHPIEVKPGYPYVYIALHYTGGCFVLYGVSAHYYQCPSKALPKSLIQLPRTMAPPKGWKQVKGLCAPNAQPKTNVDDLFGYCDAEGKWREHEYKAVCQCEAGYHEVSTKTGTECQACPVGTFKNIAGNSSCTVCPKQSQQEIDRTSCACKTGYYRADTETIFDPCTAPPSAPTQLTTTFFNATSIKMEWSPPSYSGGRSDIKYEIDCKVCDSKGEHCTNGCDNIKRYLQYLSNASTLATIKNLSPYTNYEFKVYAMNGVSEVAKNEKDDAKFSKLTVRTAEGVPGIPDIVTAKSSTSTSVFLRWKVDKPNGIIKYYQISYYPVRHEARKKVFNTTHTNVTINGLKSGTEYVFQVQAGTRLGLGKPRGTSQILPPGKNENFGPFSWEILAGIVGAAGVFLILVLIIVIICLHRKRRRYIQARSSSMEKLDGIIPVDGHKLYIDPSNYGNPMEALMSVTEEIDRRRIKLEKLIGGGEFAEVYKGTLISYDNKPETVAVKILKPKSTAKNRGDFILEASIMGQFEHANVLGLKGVVTRSPETPMMIVTEYMENGSLDHFLKNHDGNLTILQLLGMARGVSAGMDYLSAMNFIHRDLAARNILVAENMASKVADFGLSRELDDSDDNPHSEYQTQGGKIPVRWTAPEAIRYRKFSSASDVWSFGILLWEIMAFAERPYWDWDNFQVMDRVESGYRLPAPMNCPKSIHNLMLDCWDAEKGKRPKFPSIVTRIDEMIRSPEKLKSDQNHFHTLNNSNHTNFHDVHTIEEWLGSINMGRYATQFANAGYMDLGHVKSLEEEDLSRIGVRLIGHRNKINKSIKAMNKHFESMESNDSENQTFV